MVASTYRNVCLRFDRGIEYGTHKNTSYLCDDVPSTNLIASNADPWRCVCVLCNNISSDGNVLVDSISNWLVRLHADHSIRAHVCGYRLPLCVKKCLAYRANSTANNSTAENADQNCCHTFLLLIRVRMDNVYLYVHRALTVSVWQSFAFNLPRRESRLTLTQRCGR